VKKRRLITVVVVAIVLLVIGFLALRSDGPVYQGKPLTWWLENGKHEEVDAALAATGPEGTALLVELLQADDHSTAESLRQMSRRYLPFIDVDLAQERQRQALAGFQSMDTNTLPLLGTFGDLLQRGVNPVSVALAITATGAPGIPVLTNALGHPDYHVRFAAISALGYIGPDAHDAVPALIPLLRDALPLVRSGTAETLGEIHAAPDLTIPALIHALDDGKPAVQGKAIESLMEFGPAAQAAIPKLSELLKDDAVSVRAKAAEALKKIEPAGKPHPVE
jgi:hypothetical protein